MSSGYGAGTIDLRAIGHFKTLRARLRRSPDDVAVASAAPGEGAK
jgi:hypothetical protein